MDLIQQLINVKKNESSINLQDIVAELIKYDKLAKSKKFKHIIESPLLQKQMPVCWSAFNGNFEAFYLLSEASTIMQELVDYRMAIFDDIDNHYTKKKQAQLRIIGNVKNHEFHYHSLLSIPQDFTFENCFYITEQLDKETKIAIIHEKQNSTTIYQGTLNYIGNTEDKKLEPYKYQDDLQIIIKTFSTQGNNDYDYAAIQAKEEPIYVSMIDSRTFKYKYKNKHYPVKMSKADESLLNFNKDDLTLNCQLIKKYLPDILSPIVKIDRKGRGEKS